MTYLFTTTARLAPTTDAQKAMMLASQEQGLKRTGFIVPGVGIVGEQLTIDARKLEIKRLNGDVTLVHGTDVIAKFGVDEWTARDAQRIFREAKITEVCPFGTQGLSLYLSHGRPLKSLPIYTRSAKFDPASLRVMELGARWCVIDGIGRVSLPAGSQDEADRLLKLIRALNFDQICTVGHGTRHAITILAQER